MDGSTPMGGRLGPDTSVKVLIADDSLINEAVSRGFLRITFIRDGDPYERIVTFYDLVAAMSVLLTELAQVSGREKTLEEMSRK